MTCGDRVLHAIECDCEQCTNQWKYQENYMTDLVNHPPHYKGNKFESIDIIEDFSLNFNLGNAIKYILRCNKKGSKNQDLEKAIWYINREIDNAVD